MEVQLGTVPEDEEAMFDAEVAKELCFLTDEDIGNLFGGTPELLKASLQHSKVKQSVEEVTFALLHCPDAGTWEQKRIPLEETVALLEHPEQLETFNSFVEIIQPTKRQRGVSAFFSCFPVRTACCWAL